MGMGNAFGTGSYGMGWCLPCLDEGLSALLVDLKDRGFARQHASRGAQENSVARRKSTPRAPTRAASIGPIAIPRSWPAAAFAAAQSTVSPTVTQPTSKTNRSAPRISAYDLPLPGRPA